MRILIKIFLCIELLTSASHSLYAQEESIDDSLMISVNGSVKEEMGQPVSNIIIINRRTKRGSFGKADGTFLIKCYKTDTLSVTSLGYHTRNICFADSALKPVYYPVIYIEERIFRLPAAEVFAPRDLEEIQKDIARLGYDENDYMLSGINAAVSPITFLYQQFSKREQSRRQVAQFENEDRKRELLKDLFQHYVDYQIIDLSDDEFDDFINFINVSDAFLKSSTQYDFLVFVKDRFRDYKVMKRQKKLNEADYDYDKD
ncbi:MAG: hypothetical protein IT223_11160 [Crocinitomicaceae bacterium]|nr:hypothetical protein [Crocinitomicaceae bacterium]